MDARNEISKAAIKTMKQQLSELQKEVKYYTQSKSVLYSDAKKRSEDKIIKLYKALYNNKSIKNELDNKLLKVIDTITNERGGKSL